MKRGGKKGGSKNVVRWSEAQLSAYLANKGGALKGDATPAPAHDAVPKRRGKYNNEPTYVGTIKFDSKREAARYQELRRMEHAGVIRDLQLQVPFVLAEAADLGEKRKTRAKKYVADFVYVEVATGKKIVEDCKGFQTREYRLKKHWVADKYGVVIQES
jgi:hypothetical protein